MKGRILSLVLVITILLSMMTGLSGCGRGDGSSKFKVSSGKSSDLGSLEKDGWAISIPSGAFHEDKNVTVAKSSATGDNLITAPIDISVEGMDLVRLDQPVKITMKLDNDKLPDEDSFDRTVMAYWNGDKWEPIIPDPLRLSEGYLEFETWHFSSYSGKLMEEDEQVRLYAEKMAVENLTNGTPPEKYKDSLKFLCDDYLNELGIEHEATRELIYQHVLKEGHGDDIRKVAETGDLSDLKLACAQAFAMATVEACASSPLITEIITEATGRLGTMSEAVNALDAGDYKSALVAFADMGANIFGGAAGGAVTAIKSIGDLSKAAVEQGIMEWKDAELEYAYKAYAGLVKKDTYGYNLNAGDWETLTIQMRGYYNRLLSEKKEAYRKLYGKDKLSDEEIRMLEAQVDSELRKGFDERLSKEQEISKKADEYEIIIDHFKDRELLKRGLFGYSFDMTVDSRLNSLFTIRKLIIDLVGGDLSVFGDEKDREFNISMAVSTWILSNKDRRKFYDWMDEKGYLKKEVGTGEGYWKLVRSFNNDFKTSEADDNYVCSWSGGNGSYTYNCKFIGYHSYWGSTHDNCSGEFVNNTGTSSTPKSLYVGGEKVEIALKISAETSDNICLHLGASMSASISVINKDDPFISYGTDASMYDVTEKHTKSYIESYKNDTNTGYEGMSVTVGGYMPTGYADGDKVYILIGLGGGNNSVTTAYEYEWHSN